MGIYLLRKKFLNFANAFLSILNKSLTYLSVVFARNISSSSEIDRDCITNKDKWIELENTLAETYRLLNSQSCGLEVIGERQLNRDFSFFYFTIHSSDCDWGVLLWAWKASFILHIHTTNFFIGMKFKFFLAGQWNFSLLSFLLWSSWNIWIDPWHFFSVWIIQRFNILSSNVAFLLLQFLIRTIIIFISLQNHY